MARHEFGIMKEPPKKGVRYDKYEPQNDNCISVNDDDLENIVSNSGHIDCYWHTLDVKEKGLAYCGITLIPPCAMQSFIEMMKDIPALSELKELLKKALKENKWIIHFGL